MRKFSLKRKLIRIIRIIDMRKGNDQTDVQSTIRTVRESIQIKGANIWILLCGSLLASIGLDTNSMILLISAMLISPLMTPILGIGIFYYTRDMVNLNLALKKLSIALGVTIATSFIYFLITPLGELTPEISARVRPTLVDALVALIGGVSGIISITRKESSTVLPGVAVAITLMPPLCVIGFGLANMDWMIVFGSTYLFFINVTIICFVATFIIRWLDFPVLKKRSRKNKKINFQFKLAGMILLLIPCAYWSMEVLSFKNEHKELQSFIDHEIAPRAEVIDWKITKNDSIHEAEIFISGTLIPKDSLGPLYAAFDRLKLNDLQLKITQPDVQNEISKVQVEVDSIRKLIPKEEDLIAEVKIHFKQVETIRKLSNDPDTLVYGVKWNGWDALVTNRKKKMEEITSLLKSRTGKMVILKELKG
ncbi:DUF389 domain-containing protein [Ekhidna sp. MALMAid0563]|uniref:DUF389 domain-containing protein n=1 Tax=Ekhidna sp. MALMAid0563 TaxID=3143937 RepID=UPI0032DFC462